MDDRRGGPVERSAFRFGDIGVGLGGERGEPIPPVGAVVLLLVLGVGAGGGGCTERSARRPLPLA